MSPDDVTSLIEVILEHLATLGYMDLDVSTAQEDSMLWVTIEELTDSGLPTVRPQVTDVLREQEGIREELADIRDFAERELDDDDVDADWDPLERTGD